MKALARKTISCLLAATLAVCCLLPFTHGRAYAATSETDVYMVLAESAYVQLLWQKGGGYMYPGQKFTLEAEFSNCPEGATTYTWEVSVDDGVTWTPVDCDTSRWESTVEWPVGTTALIRLTATNGAGQSATAEFKIVVIFPFFPDDGDAEGDDDPNGGPGDGPDDGADEGDKPGEKPDGGEGDDGGEPGGKPGAGGATMGQTGDGALGLAAGAGLAAACSLVMIAFAVRNRNAAEGPENE